VKSLPSVNCPSQPSSDPESFSGAADEVQLALVDFRADPGSSEREDAMGEAEGLFGDQHVRRYRETGGEVGHLWREGATVLLLTTTGRTSGVARTSPVIYAQDGAHYVVVASKGGAPDHPGWYKNLDKTPEVELQVKDEVFRARARTAHGDERARLWRRMNEIWPHYEEYAKRTQREIPVVVLERS
jgi:proline iminopeptidase